MDRRQDCPDESATYLRRSLAFQLPAQIVGPTGRVSGASGAVQTRWALPTICAGKMTTGRGVLRPRDNPRGDQSTMRTKRPPNSRDGARRDKAFQNCASRRVV